MKLRTLRTALSVAVALARYNFKIIFAGKFIYFLGASLGIFILVSAITLLNADAVQTEGSVYTLLLVPGLLLIFYPITFGIQNDIDCRMIEVLFGIPDYRYKVWLIRLGLVFAMTVAMLLILSSVSTVLLLPLPVAEMTLQLAFPVIFWGCTAFLVTTLVPSGSGASVLMLMLGIGSWLLLRDYPRWYPFLNPFVLPENLNEVAWREIITANRLAMTGWTVVALLLALINLQKRERFL